MRNNESQIESSASNNKEDPRGCTRTASEGLRIKTPLKSESPRENGPRYESRYRMPRRRCGAIKIESPDLLVRLIIQETPGPLLHHLPPPSPPSCSFPLDVVIKEKTYPGGLRGKSNAGRKHEDESSDSRVNGRGAREEEEEERDERDS